MFHFVDAMQFNVNLWRRTKHRGINRHEFLVRGSRSDGLVRYNGIPGDALFSELAYIYI